MSLEHLKPPDPRKGSGFGGVRYFKQYNPSCYWRFSTDAKGEVSADGSGDWQPAACRVANMRAQIETDEAWESLTKVTKTFGTDFYSSGGALTLAPSVGLQDSGWTIEGEIHEDYYEWISNFEATHPNYGRVAGNFESTVTADSEEAFQHFYTNHTPEAWDYQDI